MAHTDTVFRDLPASRLALTRAPFSTLRRAPGQLLVAEGDARSGMFLLEEGRVRVLVDGAEVARMGPGAVFGEIGLFTETVRTATVEAVEPVVVRLLERAGYESLRAAHDPVAGWVERRAVQQLLVRFRQLVADVRLRAPQNARLIEQPVSNQRSSGTVVPLPRAVVVASLHTAFPNASVAQLEPLIGSAMVQLHAPGKTLAVAGLRDSLYGIVLAGEVAWMASVDEGAMVVTHLGPGDVFGPEPVADAKPRPVTTVARQPTTVLWVDPRLVKEHLADQGLGHVLRGPLLRTLAGALTRTNATLSLGELTNVRVRGASSPVPIDEVPAALQSDFEPLPLDPAVLPGFDEPDGDWDTWFDVTHGDAPAPPATTDDPA